MQSDTVRQTENNSILAINTPPIVKPERGRLEAAWRIRSARLLTSGLGSAWKGGMWQNRLLLKRTNDSQ